MKISSDGQTLNIEGVVEITAANAATTRDEIKKAIGSSHRVLEIDLSETTLLDSSGLGALLSVHKAMLAQGGEVKIVSPTAKALQVLEITRLHRIFEIVQ
jgi:anti-sigma B factor antagonist